MHQPGAAVAELLADVFVAADESSEQPLLLSVLQSVSTVWGDPAAMESAPHSVHLYRTVLMVALAARVGVEAKAARGIEVVSWMMKVSLPTLPFTSVCRTHQSGLHLACSNHMLQRSTI